MNQIKSRIVEKYVVKREVAQTQTNRNLQPEIGRLKAVLASLETASSTQAEWDRIDAELRKLARVVASKKSPFPEIE